MEITWLQDISNNRLDSVWYGGDIVEIKYKHYTIVISACGDIVADIKGERYRDKNNGGCFKEYLEENGINNDDDFYKAIENGDIVWYNNNWFELIIWDNKKKDYIDLCGGEVVDLEPDDDFEWIKDIIKDIEQE